MKCLKNVLVGLTLSVLGHSAAQAATIQVQMNGLNLNYNEATGTVCDSGGGNGCFGAADSLNIMQFLSDGNVIGTLVANINWNMLLYINAGTNPLVDASHATLNAANDVFDAQIGGVPGLFTDVTTGSVTFSNGGINAGGTGFSGVFSQNLPFGLNAGDPINWSFSSGLGSCTGAIGSRICTYAGTGELSWEQVPEPGSLALLGLGLIGLGFSRRRKA